MGNFRLLLIGLILKLLLLVASSPTSQQKLVTDSPSENYQNNSFKKSMSFVFTPQWANEGKGAKVIRVIGNKFLPRLDPFLMLDHFHVKLPAGFPDHPHRGFETITYMMSGSVHHEDFKGHKGTIHPGGVQWMTAGRGIVHSEIPASFEEQSIGFQLWLNLKSTEKMCEPRYQEYQKEQIPIYEKDGTIVKLICGEWEGHKGPVKYATPAYYMDVTVPPHGKFEIQISKSWNSIAYVYAGQAQYSDNNKTHLVGTRSCCVLQKSEEQNLKHKFTSQKGASFMLISGQPLNEPVFNYGPFVMNNQQQIQETFKDYQTGSNGFQNADKWESKIKHLMDGHKLEDL